MVNFYLHFKPGIAAALEPLTTSLKGGKKALEWTPALDSAFQPLAHPAPNANIPLVTEASKTHPHRWRTSPADTRLLATIGFLFSLSTTCRIEILNI
jgi:hypothetical protein